MRSLPLPLIRRLVPLNGLNEHSLQLLIEQVDWPLTGRGQLLFSLAEYERFHIYLLSGEAELIYAGGSGRRNRDAAAEPRARRTLIGASRGSQSEGDRQSGGSGGDDV